MHKSAEGFAVPMLKPRYTCMESALITSAVPAKGDRESQAKSASAKAVFPQAVGAQITTTGLSFDSVFNLFVEKLACGKRNDLSVIFFNYRVFYH